MPQSTNRTAARTNPFRHGTGPGALLVALLLAAPAPGSAGAATAPRAPDLTSMAPPAGSRFT